MRWRIFFVFTQESESALRDCHAFLTLIHSRAGMQGVVRVARHGQGIVCVARHGLNRAGLIVPQLRDELMCSTTVPKLRYDVRFLSSWGGQGGGRTSSRVFYASPAKTVDPAPSPSMPPPGIYQRIRSTIKTNVTYYRIRNSDPPFHFTSESFIPEAAEMYRNFMTALNRVDRSLLREILTERMFSRFKSHLPDKKEMKREKKKKQDKEEGTLVFVTGECSIVQARAIQIAPPVDTVFVQITCEIQVLQPEKDVVRVVFERPISVEAGRWRICDLIR